MNLVLRIALSLAVAAALIAVLLLWTGTDLDQILAALRQLDGGAYWSALAVQAAIYPVRAVRLQCLLTGDKRASVARLVPVTAAHILAANVLPAKVGEATLVVYLRRACDVPAARGLAALLVSRVLDLAAVAGSLAVACLVLAATGAFPGLDWLTPLGAVLVLATLALLWLSTQGDRIVAAATALSRFARLDRTRVGGRLVAFAERVRAALREVSRRRFWLGAASSLPVWLLVFLFYAILARGIGLGDVTFAEAVFGAGLAVLANLLPINGFAGFGPQDVGWVVGFATLGVPREQAAASAIAVHLVYLFNIGVFGLLGHLAMALFPDRRPVTGVGEEGSPPDEQHDRVSARS